MAKVIDITEKIKCEENPIIRIRDQEIKVNTDAATMLKIMGILSENENPGPREVIEMYNLMFAESERHKIDQLKLRFTDFTTLVYTAIGLVTGEGEEGEQ